MNKLRAGFVLAALLGAPASQAVEFNSVQSGQSRITFVSKQMNVPIDGKFGKFTARISFDPARPEAGRAQIEIDLNSIDAGSDDANDEVKRKGWFDVQKHPTATFVSTGVKALGGGRYEARGKMTVKGRTLDLAAPFSFRQEGNSGQFEGTLTIRRLAFGIGDGLWSDTSIVADEVLIKFRFVVAATPAT